MILMHARTHDDEHVVGVGLTYAEIDSIKAGRRRYVPLQPAELSGTLMLGYDAQLSECGFGCAKRLVVPMFVVMFSKDGMANFVSHDYSLKIDLRVASEVDASLVLWAEPDEAALEALRPFQLDNTESKGVSYDAR